MKRIRSLAIVLVFTLLFSTVFTGCQSWFDSMWEYESYYVDADGNIISGKLDASDISGTDNNNNDNSTDINDDDTDGSDDSTDVNDDTTGENESGTDKNEDNTDKNNTSTDKNENGTDKKEDSSDKGDSDTDNKDDSTDKKDEDTDKNNNNKNDNDTDKNDDSDNNVTNLNSDTKSYLDDDLNDWSKVKNRGSLLMFDGNKPALFEGDFSRVRRSGDGDCWMVWEFEAGISEFGVVTYWDHAVRDITVSVSKDNKNWTVLKNPKKSDIDLGYDWTKRVYKYYGIDKSNKYVKVDLGSTPKGDFTHSPNIARIRINNIDKMDDPNRFLEGREAKTFYLDSKNGSDNNSGYSESEPLKSLSAISKRYFQPGDKILFKSGCKFNGAVTFNGMGSGNKPIYIGTYGGKEKAKISARGGNAVSLKMQHVTMENLEITNPNGMMGINIIPVVTGKNDNITIRNCYIHDINKDQTNFEGNNYEHGGIIVMIDGLEPTWFNDLVIENNVIENVSKVGIIMTSEWTYRPGTWGREGHYKSDSDGWYPSTNVVIRGNTLDKCYGDSVLIAGAKNTLIEKNTVTNGFFNPRSISAPAATLWTTNTNDTTIQYNDISYTKLPVGCGDGEAFDIDILSIRTVIQYNYTHDNEGGMLLMCNTEESRKFNRDHIIRFNLSVNDGSSTKSHAAIMIEGKNPGTKIYNNTVYVSSNTDMIIKQYGYMDKTVTDDFTFTNNIFYGIPGKTYKWPAEYGWKNTLFDNNVFVNTNVAALKKVSGLTVKNEKTEDVKFKNPSIDLKKANRSDVIKAFTPTNKLRGATNISNNGGKDITGNKFSKIDFYGCVRY